MRRFHGVAGLCLLFGALAIGVVATWRHSWQFGAIGVALSVLWTLPVAWFYCAKCCCRLDCGHVLLGMITRILPKREPGPYTIWDGLFTALPLVMVIIYPQYWLAKEIPLLVAFWGLAIVAGVDAMSFVCRGCTNAACPFNSKRKDDRAKAGLGEPLLPA